MNDIKAKPRWLVQVHADLQRHEGFREFAYPDPLSPMGKKNFKEAGYIPGRELMQKYGYRIQDGAPWTVGYGFTRGVNPDSRMSREQANHKLYDEIYEHLKVLDKLIPTWHKMPDFVKTVLANLAFNLGYNKLSEFRNTLAAFRRHDWDAAAKGLVNSLWYRQVGTRGRELVWRLRNRQVQEEYQVADFSGVSTSFNTTAIIVR